MGGKGGALSSWLQELMALIFTQTIQAFIYAIIISFILFGMTNLTADVSTDDQNAAVGLMAVFSLMSVFKVEGLAKKIFGIKDTQANPGNAMKSLAKTAFAFQLGKRVLNNAGKITSGISKIAKSRSDNKKNKKRLEEDMKDNGFSRDENGNLSYSGGTSGGSAAASDDEEASGIDFGANTPGVVAAGGSHGGSGGGAGPSGKDARRIRDALRAYEDKADEIKKQRNEGIKSIISGSAEILTSIPGAVAGGLIAGADGDIGEMLNGIVAGAGVGDAIGESAVNFVDNATKFVKTTAKGAAGTSNRNLRRAIDEYKTAVENSYSRDVEDSQ